MASGDITADRAEASDFVGASFDGVDDIITISTFPSFPMALQGISISCDLFLRKTDGDSLLRRILGLNTYGIYTSNSENITFDCGVGNQAGSDPMIPLKSWTNSIITVSTAGVVKFYADGVFVNTSVATVSNLVNFTPTSIGNNTNKDRSWLGSIKNVKIYNCVLTPAQISEIAAGKSIKENLVAEYLLNKDYNDSVGTAHGTNDGTYLTNTIPNKLKADADSLNLAAATDKIIAIPRRGHPVIIGANREA